MKRFLLPIAAAAGALLMATPSFAGKPEWAGQGNGKKPVAQQENAVEIRFGAYFGDDQRSAARSYYGQQAGEGRCPPGLAKKNNGCQPPGQAKQWTTGKRLPSTVTYYAVPNEVVVRLGLPPSGYKYVRVANDILLIAIGTSLVVDAIEDLMR